MKLGTRARYAVTAMVDLALNAGTDKCVSLSEIAERQELPLAYLEQLFAKMKKYNLVISERGVSGGYKLAKDPSLIKISDIVDAVDESLKATRCNHEKDVGCKITGQKCLTHDLWDALTMHVHQFLSAISLSDVSQKRVFLSPYMIGMAYKNEKCHKPCNAEVDHGLS